MRHVQVAEAFVQRAVDVVSPSLCLAHVLDEAGAREEVTILGRSWPPRGSFAQVVAMPEATSSFLFLVASVCRCFRSPSLGSPLLKA